MSQSIARVIAVSFGLAMLSRPALADAPLDISFDTIKFDIAKDGEFEREMLTEKIEDLHEKTIKIRGWILPASTFQQRGIKRFVLVRDNMECCFGPGAAIYDCIMVDMQGSASVSFTTRSIAIEGVFTIKEYKYPNGKHYAIYHLDGVKVK